MADDAEENEEDLPYSQKPNWKDIVPVPQDDGPQPLACIRYPPGFEEVHSYFRAIQQKGEMSERALHLSADVIEHNSANYTAWYYRRRCLKELSSDLNAELDFANKWARDCPKNYQVWYHRRWLVMEMAEDMKKKAASPEEAAAAVQKLAEDEMEYHNDVMMVNDDWKNYNGWSHRHFIVQKFGQWKNEMKFVEDLLVDDIRNNSGWNHKHTVIRHTCWPPTDEVRNREITYTLEQLRKCANNESAWNYLSAFFGEGDGKKPWDSAPAVEEFCDGVVSLAPDREGQCRFALEVLARIHEAKGEINQAEQRYMTLKETDKIRVKYWEWRVALLNDRSKAEVPVDGSAAQAPGKGKGGY